MHTRSILAVTVVVLGVSLEPAEVSAEIFKVGLFGAGSYEECILEKMPGSESGRFSKLVMRDCRKLPNYNEPKKSPWFGPKNFSECTAKYGKNMGRSFGLKAIYFACRRLYKTAQSFDPLAVLNEIIKDAPRPEDIPDPIQPRNAAPTFSPEVERLIKGVSPPAPAPSGAPASSPEVEKLISGVGRGSVQTAPCPTGFIEDMAQGICVPKSSALEKDTSSKTVQRAQKLLTELGYKPGSIDGIYGPRTRQAIVQYQEDIRVTATGQLDDNLLAQLERSVETVEQYSTQQPTYAAKQPRKKVSTGDIISFISVPLPAFYGLTVSDLILSFIITWVIGLGPPVLIRYIFLKRPLGKWSAVLICAGFWFANFVIFLALGSRSKAHGALYLIAFVSYFILRRGTSKEQQEQGAGEKAS